MADNIAKYLEEGQQAGSRYSLVSPRRAPQGTSGTQLGRLAGESMEFMDHREYQPGDDLRRLDWSAYARSDKMIVKLYRQEVSPHLDLLIDGSRSMALEGTEKARATAGLAAALATAAMNSGYTHRAFATTDACHPVINGDELPQVWQHLNFDAVASPAEAFRCHPPRWRPRGVRVLLSDLLWLGDPLEFLLGFSEGAAAICLVQVVAAGDVEPTHLGSVRLVDSEAGTAEEVFLDAAAVGRYRANFQQHRENWLRAARQVGASLISIVAEDLCSDWNLAPLVEAGVLTY